MPPGPTSCSPAGSWPPGPGGTGSGPCGPCLKTTVTCSDSGRGRPVTVKEALDGYALDLQARGGESGNVSRVRHHLSPALAATPGVTMSAMAVGTGLRSAQSHQRRGWLVAQDVWLALVIVATLAITLWFNSNDLPWFFSLIALPLVTLLYWIFNR